MVGQISPVSHHNIQDLNQRVKSYIRDSRQQTTWKGYANCWQRFVNFCSPADAWNAKPEDLARYCASMADIGRSPETIRANLAAITFYFEVLGKGHAHGRTGVATRPSPAKSEIVRHVLRGISRGRNPSPRRKMALMLDSLEKMIDAMPNTLIGKRDRAMLALCWAGARRGCEIIGLDLTSKGNGSGWIEMTDAGIVISLRRSKGNPHGRYIERYGIPARHSAPRYCPVVLLKEWLAAGGHTDG